MLDANQQPENPFSIVAPPTFVNFVQNILTRPCVYATVTAIQWVRWT